jgi:DNA topoisomerase-1
VTLIAEKVAKGPRGRRFGADPGRELGDHPDKGGPIVLKKGRYGPYVSHDGVNATLRQGQEPDNVTVEDAVALLAARAERNGGAPARRRSGAGKRSAKTATKAAPKSTKRGNTARTAKQPPPTRASAKRAGKASATE